MDFKIQPILEKGRRFFAKKEDVAKENFENLGPLFLVSDFLGRHKIDPNPTNYELIYRYTVLEETGLEPHIEELISKPLTNRWSGAFDSGSLSGTELREIADAVYSQLTNVEKAIGTYAMDAKGYGEALHDNQAQLTSSPSNKVVLDGLINLTKRMVDKARDAERYLQDRNEAVKNLKTSLADAQLKADTDMLTGLSNRRAFERTLGAACERAKLTDISVVLAICDVDHFKKVNDQFGHLTGDRILKLAGEILQDQCGQHGSVSRFGGEEFVILFEGLSVEEAFNFVEAAKIDLSNRSLVKRETKEPIGKVTFSAGLASYEQAKSPEALLHIADLALYEAKANGRDCIFGANVH